MNRALSVTLVIGGFFLIWELCVRFFVVPNYILPAPSAIAVELFSNPLWYGRHALYTIGACMMGFLLALVIGVAAAIGIVYSKVLENTLYTLLVSLNSIPKIALAPLFIIWMGTGTSSKVAISMLIALFAIVIDTVLGLRSVDPDVLELTKSMKATPFQVLWKVRFPTALPAMFAGMKVAISLALVGAIAGEFVASQVGLGYAILTAQGMFQITSVFASIVLLGVLGTVLFYLMNLIEHWLVPWHVSQRADRGAAH
ncbi:ABC transporter permease [Rhodoplanes sp. Z2-YC6860]|uniref:ABC transporter permease n=1 Tax=Rhodoplanes sp. Z2-YC6860 TaxID=674703 RepID=UPI00078DDA02|nr:ABC transporter permease [Rhodoplanes sp. Z2-YC6860]AMN41479.1 ABC transporter permease [Rhodoplanes sp. Z2-YC6860]